MIDLHTHAYDGGYRQPHATRLNKDDADWMREVFADAIAHNRTEARSALTRLGYWSLTVPADADDLLGAADAIRRGASDMHAAIEGIIRMSELGARLCVPGYEGQD